MGYSWSLGFKNKLNAVVILALTLISAGPAFAQNYVEGDVIVKFKSHVNPSQATIQGKPGRRLGKQASFNEIKIQHYKGLDGQTTQELMNEIANNPDVEYVEPNYIIRKTEIEGTQAYSLAEVQGFASGFGLTSADIAGVEGWDEIASNNSPIVAIIDTGVQLAHDALIDALWVNPGEVAFNGIDDDGNGFTDDIYGWNFSNSNNNPNDCDGHGTHVAGIVRGTTQYLFEGPPDTPVLQIMALKFLDCNGMGTTSNAIKAIRYAVNNGAKILNNSWGGGDYSQSLHEAIVYAYENETLFVAAAGNYSNNNDSSKLYPASYPVPNVISVAATTDADGLASFSNYGKKNVHVAAPGVWVLSTYLGNEYAQMSGTSMAAPIVSGVAALMANEKPTMNGYQMRNLLLGASDVVGSLTGKVQGSRRLNSQSSVISAKSTAVDPYLPAYKISASADDRKLAGELASGGGGCGLVAEMAHDLNNRSQKPPKSNSGVFGLLFLLPILLWMYMRRYVDPKQRRQFQRFATSSELEVRFNGELLKASLQTVSIGGAGFVMSSESQLKKGDRVLISLKQPDGKNTLELVGEAVFVSPNGEVGLRFHQPMEWVVDLFSNWKFQLSEA